jgi:hypothetical protein
MNFKLSNDLSVRKIDAEIFVLNRKDSRLHAFNDTGALLWELVQKFQSSTPLVQALIDNYEVDQASAEKDVEAFIRDLFNAGLLDPYDRQHSI